MPARKTIPPNALLKISSRREKQVESRWLNSPPNPVDLTPVAFDGLIIEMPDELACSLAGIAAWAALIEARAREGLTHAGALRGGHGLAPED
jgi:hypothetical protein